MGAENEATTGDLSVTLPRQTSTGSITDDEGDEPLPLGAGTGLLSDDEEEDPRPPRFVDDQNHDQHQPANRFEDEDSEFEDEDSDFEAPPPVPFQPALQAPAQLLNQLAPGPLPPALHAAAPAPGPPDDDADDDENDEENGDPKDAARPGSSRDSRTEGEENEIQFSDAKLFEYSMCISKVITKQQARQRSTSDFQDHDEFLETSRIVDRILAPHPEAKEAMVAAVNR